MERNVSEGRGKIPVIVAVAVALTGLAPLVVGRLGQLLRLLLQQLVQCFFHAAPNQFLDLPPDYLLVQLYNLFGYGLQTPFRMVCANFILPDACKPCLFLSSIQFAQFILPYPPNPATMVEFSAALTKRPRSILPCFTINVQALC